MIGAREGIVAPALGKRHDRVDVRVDGELGLARHLGRRRRQPEGVGDRGLEGADGEHASTLGGEAVCSPGQGPGGEG